MRPIEVSKVTRAPCWVSSALTIAIVISGIDLTRKIKKGQFNVHRLMKRAGDIHDMWMAVLVA
jgi:hypothetical protein